MPLPSKPQSLIVPVVSGVANSGLADELWGTGFFVGPRLLMSAKHVLGVQPPLGHCLSVVHIDPRPPYPIAINAVYCDPNFDVAIARVDEWPNEEYLSITPGDVLIMNHGVLTVEYSPTRQHVPLPGGVFAMDISANWHQGHIVREYVSDFGHLHPTRVIDLSYPAFRRASGAPVVHNTSGEVLGLVVSNVERHLMPAHLERIESPDGVVEEVRYYVPNGQAIRANHLRDCLQAGVEQLATSS